MKKLMKNLMHLAFIGATPVHTTMSFATNKTIGVMNVSIKSFQMSVALTLITYMLPTNINTLPFGTRYKCIPLLNAGHLKTKNQSLPSEYACLPIDLATVSNAQKM